LDARHRVLSRRDVERLYGGRTGVSSFALSTLLSIISLAAQMAWCWIIFSLRFIFYRVAFAINRVIAANSTREGSATEGRRAASMIAEYSSRCHHSSYNYRFCL